MIMTNGIYNAHNHRMFNALRAKMKLEATDMWFLRSSEVNTTDLMESKKKSNETDLRI